MRGATVSRLVILLAVTISTHAPLAGRDRARSDELNIVDISTHAPLAGRDASASSFEVRHGEISTHAPLAGRDNERMSGAKRR